MGNQWGAYPTLISHGLKHKSNGFNSSLRGVFNSITGLHNLFHKKRRSRTNLPLTLLSSDEAKNHSFFHTFWARARNEYGITARRDRADLQWRFWENPNAQFITLVLDHSMDGAAYAIVQLNGDHVFTLVDVVCFPATSHLYLKMIEAVCSCVYALGGNLLLFWTTSDFHHFDEAFTSLQYPNLFNGFPFNRFIEQKGSNMPRRVHRKSLKSSNWFVTPIVFEGR